MFSRKCTVSLNATIHIKRDEVFAILNDICDWLEQSRSTNNKGISSICSKLCENEW